MQEACDECGAHWAGRRSWHCGGCCQTFLGGPAFHRHRRERRCVPPQDVGLAPVTVLRPVPWLAWRLPDVRARRLPPSASRILIKHKAVV